MTDDLQWLGVMAGLFLLTIAWLRVCGGEGEG
jgi:hypothetical protein